MKFKKSFSLSVIFLLFNCSNYEVIDIPSESIIDSSNFEDILSAEGLKESGLYWKDKNNNSVLEAIEIKGGKNFLFIEDSNNSVINNIAQLDQTYSALTKEDIKLYLQNIIKTDDILKMRKFSLSNKKYLGRWDPDFSPILFSIKNNALNSLDYMLEEDVRDFVLKEEFEQILIKAVGNNNKEVVELILKKTDLINLQTENGTTALMHAIKNGNNEIAKLLLEKGADKEIMDANKKTALMHAYINNNEDAKQLLGIPEKMVLEVPLMLQSFDLTCEAISAAMIAEYYEYELPETDDSDQEYQSWEDYFMKVIEPDPNPHLGFRGDIYGRMSTYDNVEGYGYGVYAEPIHKALTEVGYDAEVKYGVDYDDIEHDLRSGNPVILWVSSQRTPAEIVQIEDKDVRLVYGEHAWVVLGVQGNGNNRKFLVNHSVYNKQYWKSNFIRWGDFQNEEGIGGMRVIVRS